MTIRIGSSYEAIGGSVLGGDFSIIVDPQDIAFTGAPIEFFLAGMKASQTVPYQPGEIVSNIILTFGALSTPTPVPTPVPTATSVPTPTSTPEPTATPEPTRTPTPVPTSTPAPTATPTPTAIPVIATATAIPEPTAMPVVVDVVVDVVEGLGDQDEDEHLREPGGGLCSANPGGPASGGQIGLLLAPLALGFWIRMKRKTAEAPVD